MVKYIHEKKVEGLWMGVHTIIQAAKQKGKKSGCPALTFPENWDEVYAEWTDGKITAKRAMELTDTKRTSFYKPVGKTN